MLVIAAGCSHGWLTDCESTKTMLLFSGSCSTQYFSFIHLDIDIHPWKFECWTCLCDFGVSTEKRRFLHCDKPSGQSHNGQPLWVTIHILFLTREMSKELTLWKLVFDVCVLCFVLDMCLDWFCKFDLHIILHIKRVLKHVIIYHKLWSSWYDPVWLTGL